MKFVSAKKPCHYGDELHEVQLKLSKLRKQIAELEAKEKALASFLRKFAHDETFQFDSSDGYVKQVSFKDTGRMVIDLDAVRRMLKSRVPYKQGGGLKVKVDYVYTKR